MNNDTKRDVFEKMKWELISNLANTIDQNGGLRPLEDATKVGENYATRYADALPDDTPVIPKEVGEYIRAKKRKNTSQSVYYLLRDTGVLWRRKKESKILSYMHDDPDTFARAWLLGVWRVQETGEIVKLEEDK